MFATFDPMKDYAEPTPSDNEPIGNERMYAFARKTAILIADDLSESYSADVLKDAIAKSYHGVGCLLCGMDSHVELALCHYILSLRIPLIMVSYEPLCRTWTTEVLHAVFDQRVFIMSLADEFNNWTDKQAMLRFRNGVMVANSTSAIVCGSNPTISALLAQADEKYSILNI